MMHMHEKVSGKITRSEKTWNINGEMIKNKKLYCEKFCMKTILSLFSFFYHNHLTCTTFQAVA